MIQLVRSLTAVLCISVAVYAVTRLPNLPVPAMLLVLGAGYLGAVYGSTWVWRALVRLGARESRLGPTLDELEILGLIQDDTFEASRACALHSGDEEDPAYLLELVDGRAMFLSGPYLWAFEEETEEPEIMQDRLFPCTRFRIRRHRTEGHVLELQRLGPVLRLDQTPPLLRAERDRVLGSKVDGEIWRGASYASLLRAAG